MKPKPIPYKMQIYSSHSDLDPKNPTFIHHMKRIQLVSWFPLSLSTESFSEVSKIFLFLSILQIALTLLHLLSPKVSLHWKGSGPFSTALSLIKEVAMGAIPAIYVMTALLKKSRFQETTKSLLSVLKQLGLLEYRMFLSCKIAVCIYGFCVLTSASIMIVLWFRGGGWAKALNFILNAVFTTYVVSWAFHFFYTVRTIEACFLKLTQTTVNQSNLEHFFRLYNSLIEIGSDTNEFYDFPVSSVMLLFLIHFIDVTGLVLTPRSADLTGKLVLCFVATCIMAIIVCFLRNCQAATDQVDRSNEALRKFIVHGRSSMMHFDNQLLLIHLCSRRKLVFRVAKSFPINYKLGISVSPRTLIHLNHHSHQLLMVSAYVTYTIVFLQIEPTSSS